MRALRNRRGSVIPFVAVAMVMLLGFTALAFDMGRMYTAKVEVRRATDAATMAAVTAWGDTGDSATAVTQATSRASTYLGYNPIQNRSLPSDDVTVSGSKTNQTMQVTVTAKIKTAFARILGLNSVLVRSSATAGYAATGSVRCLRPFAIADAWQDANQTYYDAGDYYRTDSTGYGTNYRNASGYTKDFGRQIAIRKFDTTGPSANQVKTGSYLLLQLGALDPSVAANTRNLIKDTTCTNNSYTVGDSITGKTGASNGNVIQAIQDLYDYDTGLTWNSSSKTFTGSAYSDWRESPRVMTVTLYDPSSTPTDGSKIRVVGFAALVIDLRPANPSQDSIVVRLANVRGIPRACATGSCGNLSKFVHLTN